MDKKPGLVGGPIAIVAIHFSVVWLLSTIQLGRYAWIGVFTILVGVLGSGLVLAHSHDRIRQNGVRGAGLILVAFVMAVAPWELVKTTSELPFWKVFLTVLIAPPLAIAGGVSLAHAVPPTHGSYWKQLPHRLLLPLGAVLPILTWAVVISSPAARSLTIQGPLGLALVSGLADWFWAGLNRG